MNAAALLLVDLQNDYFADGKSPLVGINSAADNARRLLDAARANGQILVHIRHEIPSAEAPFFAPGSVGAQIHPIVEPLEGETVILKNHANSFRNTELQNLLDEEGIKNVVICGAMSHMCIDATARASAELGYGVTVVHDACATKDLIFNEESVTAAKVHAAFMAGLNGVYATMSTTENHLNAPA